MFEVKMIWAIPGQLRAQAKSLRVFQEPIQICVPLTIIQGYKCHKTQREGDAVEE